MIAVDSSALVAIVLEEPEGQALAVALTRSQAVLICDIISLHIYVLNVDVVF
jgi:uncharacterized protein with PIN domain